MPFSQAHACLPLHPQADFSPLDQLRAAGVHYVSVNVGMDMNPLAQILPVIAAFRARIAAPPARFRLVSSVAQIQAAAAAGALARIAYTPVDTWRRLPEALRKVGMSLAEAALVMGDNMLHVAGQVWRPA